MIDIDVKTIAKVIKQSKLTEHGEEVSEFI